MFVVKSADRAQPVVWSHGSRLRRRVLTSPILCGVAVAALLAGCSTARLSKPQVHMPAAYEAAGDTNDNAPPDTLDHWWRLFDDAQLTDLIEKALVAAPDARIALQRIGEARATRTQTLAAYLPQGNLQALGQEQHTNETISGLSGDVGVGGGALSGAGSSTGGLGSSLVQPSGDLQTYGAQFNVTYELDVFRRQRAAKRAANADVAAARFDYEATRAMLAKNVAVDLFQARGTAIQLDQARDTLRIAQDLAKSGEVSASHGLTSTSDVARLETDVGVDAAEVARLEGVLIADKRALLALLGRGTEAADSLTIEAVASPPPAPPSSAPGELLRRRPDVREAEEKLRSAVNTLALDKLALLPTFDLMPGFQADKTGGSYVSTATIWTIGAGAAMPVLDRPRLLAVIRGQKAKGEEAVVTYEQTVQNAYRDAESGLSTLASDRRRVKQLEDATERSRYAFDAKKKGYDLGLVDLTTLLTAETTWRNTRTTLATAKTQGLVDAATLFQALGGGWTPPEEVKTAAAR
jgi:NodT family efflux transporter outer membrane factor (OMF) lipoprotein